jgi:uncharacterized protein (UPF0264 family)
VTGLLASAASEAEAALALEGGADIIDLKDPAAGALGALPLPEIRAAVRRVAARQTLSATIGDHVSDPVSAAAAVASTAAAGVDLVKVGFFAGSDHRAMAGALSVEAAKGTRVVAVLFADQDPDFSLVGRLAGCGFAGVMLDTADKAGGSLRRCFDDARLGRFVEAARRLGLLSGLAGSLGPGDVAPLIGLGPDYLGFRGALCGRGGRKGGIDPGRLREMAALFRAQRPPGNSAARAATATAGAHLAAHSRASLPPFTREEKST